MNKKMLIYIADLHYYQQWDIIHPFPLNAGYVAALLKKLLPEVSVEIFKDPRVLIDRISDAPPAVLALSHYIWNSNLNLVVLKHAKRTQPKTITVMGGPNFEAGDPEWSRNFFSQRPLLDLHITGEGEWSFARLIELLMNYKGELSRIPYSERPSSFYSFDHQHKRVIHNPSNPVDSLDLDTVPSPYLTGLMDPFFKNRHLSPIIETNRGCPYFCTFCCWGNAIGSKVRTFPLETALEEIRYIAERSRNRDGLFYVADANFGIVKRDLEIARYIQECVRKYSFAKRMFIYFSKNINENLINIADALKSLVPMSMSKQSLNPDVLKNIKRSNIPPEQYDILADECKKRGINTYCELIYGLPGESYQSFVDGVITSVRKGQPVAPYVYSMNPGAESFSRQSRERYKVRTAFRINPRYVSSYENINSLEYEEIVIGTKDLTETDYHRLRMFHLMLFILDQGTPFLDFRRGLKTCGLDHATLSSLIINDEKNWTPRWRDFLNSFRESSKKELLFKDQLKLEFSAEDISKINRYQIALNPFYMAKIVADRKLIPDLRRYLAEAIKRFFGMSISDVDMHDLIKTLDLSFDKIIYYDELLPEKVLIYEYDIDSWIASEEPLPLRNFHLKKPVPYRLYIDDYILSTIKHVKVLTDDMAEVAYICRMRQMGAYANRAYCYERSLASQQ